MSRINLDTILKKIAAMPVIKIADKKKQSVKMAAYNGEELMPLLPSIAISTIKRSA